MAKLSNLTSRLYTGEISYDFIGHRRRWYIFSAILITVSILALLVRGLVFGIEFRGGADFKAPVQVTEQTVDQVREAVVATGLPELDDSIVNTIGDNQVRVQTRTLNPTTEVPVVRAAIGEEVGVAPDQVAYNLIGASWGDQITERGLIALAVFLALVALVIWVYFRDGKMAGAALIALAHDLLLTIGIYALVGFTVTPATLIGLLTILGYSLYDTVVVFDKVKENTRGLLGLTRRTYAEAANLALNQTLMRSINTSLIAVLPVVGLMVIGVGLLGVGTLADLALVQMVGIIAGALSSLLLATPLLVDLKMRDRRYAEHATRVVARRNRMTSAGVAGEPVGNGTEPASDVAGPDLSDDDVLATELRRERAMAAAAGAPSRSGKSTRTGGAHAVRPRGKSGRPSGKRHR